MLTLPVFTWSRPKTVDEAMRVLAENPGECLIVAGGTDAVPNLKHRLHEPKRLVHLGAVEELRGIRVTAEGLEVGALATLAELAAHPYVREHYAGVADAAANVASPQIRNMGTVGGNLCLDTRCTYYNQTFFWREALGFCLKKDGTRCHVVPQGKRCVAAHSSDVAPVWIALGAQVEIATPAADGAVTRRVLPVESFFVDQPENYSLTFNADGKVAIKADCNKATGSYQSEETNLAIKIGGMTRTACPPESRGWGERREVPLPRESLPDGRLERSGGTGGWRPACPSQWPQAARSLAESARARSRRQHPPGRAAVARRSFRGRDHHRRAT